MRVKGWRIVIPIFNANLDDGRGAEVARVAGAHLQHMLRLGLWEMRGRNGEWMKKLQYYMNMQIPLPAYLSVQWTLSAQNVASVLVNGEMLLRIAAGNRVFDVVAAAALLRFSIPALIVRVRRFNLQQNVI